MMLNCLRFVKATKVPYAVTHWCRLGKGTDVANAIAQYNASSWEAGHYHSNDPTWVIQTGAKFRTGSVAIYCGKKYWEAITKVADPHPTLTCDIFLLRTGGVKTGYYNYYHTPDYYYADRRVASESRDSLMAGFVAGGAEYKPAAQKPDMGAWNINTYHNGTGWATLPPSFWTYWTHLHSVWAVKDFSRDGGFVYRWKVNP